MYGVNRGEEKKVGFFLYIGKSRERKGDDDGRDKEDKRNVEKVKEIKKKKRENSHETLIIIVLQHERNKK